MKYLLPLTVGVLVIWLFVANATPTEPADPLGAKERTISSMLVGKTGSEREDIKSTELVKLPIVGTYTSGDLTIEIQSVAKIDRGIELFVRAWKNGVPLGFGADGSVEIERFRIFNPPIMVPDGTKRTVTRLDTTYEMDNFKEDPIAATRDSLAHTISLVGKEGTAIVSGKRGNTTSTFYPAAGANSPADGYTSLALASWDAAHDGTSAGADASDASFDVLDDTTFIERAVTMFNTGTIDSGDTISSATVSLYVNSKTNNDNDGQDYIGLVQLKSTYTASSNVQAGDYNDIGSAVDNPTQGATGIDVGSITTSAYNTWTLNATGLTWIARSGETLPAGFPTAEITALGWRGGHDIEDAPPAARNAIFVRSADVADTTSDPKLVVEHAAGGGGGSAGWNEVYIISE